MNALPAIVAPVETVYAEYVIPNMTFSDILDRIGDIGEDAGRGKASPMNVGLELAQYAEFFAGNEQDHKVRQAYLRYAERANAASKFELAVDTSNEKSITAQVSKLNVFVNAGGSIGSDECVDLINSVIKEIKNLEGRKPSVYETVLTVLRKQKGNKPLDSDEVSELVNKAHEKAQPKAKPEVTKTVELTEKTSLQDIVHRLSLHNVTWQDADLTAALALCQKKLASL